MYIDFSIYANQIISIIIINLENYFLFQIWQSLVAEVLEVFQRMVHRRIQFGQNRIGLKVNSKTLHFFFYLRPGENWNVKVTMTQITFDKS